MARDFIKIDTTQGQTNQSTLLKNYVVTLRNAYELGNRVKAIMIHNNDGTVFTDIESLFGLPAGKGQILFNFVNGSIGAMEGTFQNSDSKNITEQVG